MRVCLLYEGSKLHDRRGFFIQQAQKIKEVMDIPVIVVGGITDPKYANLLIQEGHVDLVAVDRAHLNDPDLSIKAINTGLKTI